MAGLLESILLWSSLVLQQYPHGVTCCIRSISFICPTQDNSIIGDPERCKPNSKFPHIYSVTNPPGLYLHTQLFP